MNKFALSPNSLVGVPALDYLDALVKAEYDGIGLRMYASPGVTYESVTQPLAGNPALMRDVTRALADSGLILYDILSYSLLKEYEPRLFPYTQIDDGVDTDGPPPRGRREPGQGSVPLDGILDALPADLPLSIEWSAPRDAAYTPAEWAKIALDATKRYVDGYYARKAASTANAPSA